MEVNTSHRVLIDLLVDTSTSLSKTKSETSKTDRPPSLVLSPRLQTVVDGMFNK